MEKNRVQASDEQAKQAPQEATPEATQKPTQDQKTESVTEQSEAKCSLVLGDGTICDKPLGHEGEHGSPLPSEPSAADLDAIAADPSLAPAAKFEESTNIGLSASSKVKCRALRDFPIGDRKVIRGEKLELSLADYDGLTGVMPNALKLIPSLDDRKHGFFVNSDLRINGRFYKPGQAIMLEEEQAIQLVNAGAVSPLKEE